MFLQHDPTFPPYCTSLLIAFKILFLPYCVLLCVSVHVSASLVSQVRSALTKLYSELTDI